MNKVFLNGYLAQDPKPRITSKGMEQSNFTVAVNDLKNINDTYFIPCVVWGNTAKFVNTNLKKGSFVAVDGRLSKRKYVMQNGMTSYVTEVLVDNIKNFGIYSRNNNENNQTISTTSNSFNSNENNENNNSIENDPISKSYNDILVEIDHVINSGKSDQNLSNESEIENEDTSDFEEFDELEWDKEFN